MTRRALMRWVLFAILVYLCYGALLTWFKFVDRFDELYVLLKDGAIFVSALPAAWLAACFQRRTSFLEQLRDLWSQLVDAVQEAVQYTHLEAPTQAQYASVMKKLSAVIDEFRSVFRNLDETRDVPDSGYFPFESIRAIYHLIGDLGYGATFKSDRALATRREVIQLWRRLRQPLLQEFDRQRPSRTDIVTAAGLSPR
jgi:hypothetical protein